MLAVLTITGFALLAFLLLMLAVILFASGSYESEIEALEAKMVNNRSRSIET